ncbi:Nucleic-acid-binding protein from transposon X-element [Anthophora plagiata]
MPRGQIKATPEQNKTIREVTFTCKPPPINILYQDPKETVQLISHSSSQGNFHIKRISKTKHVLQLNTLEDFQKAKRLPESFSEQEIMGELQSRANNELRFEKITRFKTAKSVREGRTLPIYLLQISADSDLKNLNNIKYINHHIIKWEKLKKKGDAQCRRCQRFGHSAINCNLNYRCVKCKDQHEPGNCVRGKDAIEQMNSKPFCVNCNTEGHPASYRGCPKFTEYKENLQIQKNKNKINTPTIIANPAFIKPGLSYANTLKGTDMDTHPTKPISHNNTSNQNTQNKQKEQQDIHILQVRTERLEKTMETLVANLERMSTQMNHLANMLTTGYHIQ